MGETLLLGRGSGNPAGPNAIIPSRVSANNRKARYYEITPAGRKWLKTQIRQWLNYTRLVTGILSPATRSA